MGKFLSTIGNSAISITLSNRIEQVVGGNVDHCRDGNQIILSMSLKTAQKLSEWIKENAEGDIE